MLLRPRFLRLTGLLLGLSSLAFGHYHWSYFAHASAPYRDIPLKYDLASLQDKTVSVFISKTGPAKLVDGDSFPSLVSQIRRAAEVWNGVASSSLRLRFGGLVDYPATQPTAAQLLTDRTTPSVEVFFDDELPPGILALTWPQTRDDLSYLAVASTPEKPVPSFAPMLKARVQLRNDLSPNGQASYSDDFFLTIVHELGHALGLQHSTSSAVMSTSITRGTSGANPLAPDDVAGISYLYPTPEYLPTVGSIAGKITSGTATPNLASVVALATGATASNAGVVINTMTNPDGTYRIEGLPPGEYFLYAHPLPPAQSGEGLPAAIVPQTVVDGKNPVTPFPASTGYETRFFPGTREWTQASKIMVRAAETVDKVNLDLPRTTALAVHNLRTFAYLGSNPLHAPPLAQDFRNWLVMNGTGMVVNGTQRLAPGLRVSPIGGPLAVDATTLQYWKDAAAYGDFVLILGTASQVAAMTPVALAVNTDNGLYVLPAAYSVVPTAHPSVTQVSDAGAGEVRVEGSNLDAGTRIMFDGVDALSVRANDDGSVNAVAPPATGAQKSALEALTRNGQTSWQFLGSAPPQFYTYAAPDQPSVSLSLGDVTAGTDVWLRVDGVNTNFLAAKFPVGTPSNQSVVGFGSSEVVARQVWTVSPTQLLVNIGVTSSAKAGPVAVTVATGLQTVTLAGALQVHPVSTPPVSLQAPILNLVTGMAAAPVGGTVAIRATGLPSDLTGWTIRMGGVPAVLTRTGPAELHVDVPSLEPGVVPVQLIAPDGTAIPPVLLQVDAPPPLIMVIGVENGTSFKNFPLASVGSHVTVDFEGAGIEVATATAEMIQVRVGGLRQTVTEVRPISATGLRVSFDLSQNVPADSQQDVTVGLGTRVSMPRTLVVAP